MYSTRQAELSQVEKLICSDFSSWKMEFNSSQNGIAKNVKSDLGYIFVFMNVLKIIALIATVLICSVIFVLVMSRTTVEAISEHPLIGQKYSPGATVYYMEHCNNLHSCGETKFVREIDRRLVCGKTNPSMTSVFDNTYRLSKDTTFELVRLQKIKYHWFAGIGGPDHIVAVLRDDKNLLSVIFFSLLMSVENPRGFQNGTICMES